MSQPHPPAGPHGDGASPPEPSPGWAPPAPEWVARTPPWPPPGAHPPPGPAVPATGLLVRRPVVAALGAAVVLVLGAAVAAAVGTLVLLGGAERAGERLGAGIGAELARVQEEQMEDLLAQEGVFSEPFGSAGPVQQSEATEPGELGPDPTLDRYAQACFEGELQACDDLFFQSPPFSEYERYGGTCGGRVKQSTVAYCTELE